MTSPTSLAVSLLALGLLASGCRHAVLGQPIAPHGLAAKPEDFAVDPDIVVLHYYGVGGWGILWKGSYLLTAPYFSNHGYWASSVGAATPDRKAIWKGFEGTPFPRTSVILVGHGHVDHASDIPAYPFDEIHGRPTLVADESTIRLLGNETRQRVCPVALPARDGTVPLPTDGDCPTGNFRIWALPWAHAPHVKLCVADARLTAGDPQGTQDTDLEEPPARGNDWLVGRTWAFVIELLDAGRPVFRIHYVDTAANPSFVGPQPWMDAATDVHIGCIPGFDIVEGYPSGVIERHRVKYVLAGHWENFFRDRECRLEPVQVLDDEKMGEFVTQAQGAIGTPHPESTPINKGDCPAREDCGPSGPSWTVPIPGETFWFRAAEGSRADAP